MKAVFVIFAAVVAAVSVTTAQISRRPDDLRWERYPYAKVAHERRTRDLKIDPQTGTVSGNYPVGGGDISGKVDPQTGAVSGNYPVGGGDIFGKVQGATGEFGYKHNVFDNNNGKLDASLVHGRDLGMDLSSMGGRLDWTGDRAQATVDVSRYSNGFTNLNAAGGAKWPLTKDIDASLQGTYSQTFGQGRPDYGVLGTIRGRW